MAIITPKEIFDVVVMTIAVGYIFMHFLKKPVHSPDYYLKGRGFDWETFKMACWVTAPALILHELAHKFVALGFGFNAVFHAAYIFLAIGVILRLAGSNFIFFVPAYVAIGCRTVACSIPAINDDEANNVSFITQFQGDNGMTVQFRKHYNAATGAVFGTCEVLLGATMASGARMQRLISA